MVSFFFCKKKKDELFCFLFYVPSSGARGGRLPICPCETGHFKPVILEESCLQLVPQASFSFVPPALQM